MTLLDKLKKELEYGRRKHREREERIINYEMEASDGFVSSWASDLSTRLLEKKIEILENGGYDEFTCLADLEGNKVPHSKYVQTRYGGRYVINHPDGRAEWVNPYVKEKTLKKKGYMIGTEKLPAWAKLSGNGTGLSGALSVRVVTFPSDKNYAEE